jgi:hypothetical protein
MVGGSRIGDRRIGVFYGVSRTQVDWKGQSFGRMEWKQLEVPLGPEWRAAGLAARDNEG